MYIVLVPVLLVFLSPGVSVFPDVRYSAVRRLSAQQYQDNYNIPAAEQASHLTIGWPRTVRPPFSWEFSPSETRDPEEISVAGIPVRTSSYFDNRHGPDKPEALVSFSNKNVKTDHSLPRKPETNTVELQGGIVNQRKSKNKKAKKQRNKNTRNKVKVSGNCTEVAGSNLPRDKLCEAQRRQIKKERAQRRKKRRRMKELRRERLRRKKKHKKKFDKPVDKEFQVGDSRDKFFSFHQVINNSHHGAVVTSPSNSSAGDLEKTREASLSSTSTTRPDIANNATMTNEVFDVETNAGTSEKNHETIHIQKDTTSGIPGNSPGGGPIIGPYSNGELTTAISVHGYEQEGHITTVGFRSTTEHTTERMNVNFGGPTSPSAGNLKPVERINLSRADDGNSIFQPDDVIFSWLDKHVNASQKNAHMNFSKPDEHDGVLQPNNSEGLLQLYEHTNLPQPVEPANISQTDEHISLSLPDERVNISKPNDHNGLPQPDVSNRPTLPDDHDGFSQHNMVDVSGPLLGSEKGDLSCVIGRFLPAPAVKHADIKYIRSGDGTDGTLVARYECLLGHRLEKAAAYRMWCSKRSWRGEVPRCVPSGEELSELDSSAHCPQCDQVCQHREGQSPLCSCYRGFKLLETTCLDINECKIDNGGCQDECINTAGSYFCRCPQGFRVDINGKICRDINECLLRNGHGPCQDTCTNLHGSYSCTCDGISGTKLSSDNHTCEDVDECAAGTAGCSHTCLNTLGRVFCLCPPGFELGPDWKTCQDLNECEDRQLQSEECDGECVNTVGSYLCRSPGDQPAEDCSGNSPLCRSRYYSTTEVVNVTCDEGLRQSSSDGQCEDLDECDVNNGGCSHYCVNTHSSFHCACMPGFALDVDSKSCIEAARAAVCPPLDTPGHGYLQCERQLIMVRGGPRYRKRRRVVNHAGTVCRLRCPLGSGLRGDYIRTCTTAGTWAGPHDGVCLQIHYVDSDDVLQSLPLKRSLRGWGVYQYPRRSGNYIRVTFGFMVPSITCPENVTTWLPPGQRTTHVVFDQPSSSVDWFRHVISEPLWGKQLEGDLPLGTWKVKFVARHPVSQLSASCTIAITVNEW